MGQREDAMALRDRAVALVKAKGAWDMVEDTKVLAVQSGDTRIAYRTPFQRPGGPSDADKYAAAVAGVRRLPYALGVWWRGSMEVHLEWDDAGRFEVVTFRRGPWERHLSVS